MSDSTNPVDRLQALYAAKAPMFYREIETAWPTIRAVLRAAQAWNDAETLQENNRAVRRLSEAVEALNASTVASTAADDPQKERPAE